MNKKMVTLVILLTLMVTLVACGGEASTPVEPTATVATGASNTAPALDESYADALPVAMQLTLGTLKLEETPNAVTTGQAQELLPLWQMMQALQGSSTASQVESDAVAKQIQGAMTADQLAAIKEMQLTPTSMMEAVQQMGFGRGAAGDAGQTKGFSPPAGVAPPGGAGGSAAFGSGGETDLSPEEQEAAAAERMNTLMGTAMTDKLISLLEARAEGQTVEVASPNQEFETTRVMLGVVSEATGLDQQEIMAQVREGETLAEIAEATGADLDEILAQGVAAESERVNQAVSDETLEQRDADDMLVDLEARVKEALEQPLQLDGRGSGQP